MLTWVWPQWGIIWTEVLTRKQFQPGGSWGGDPSTCQSPCKTRRWKTQCESATQASAGWCPRQSWRDYWVIHTRATWWIVCNSSRVSSTFLPLCCAAQVAAVIVVCLLDKGWARTGRLDDTFPAPGWDVVIFCTVQCNTGVVTKEETRWWQIWRLQRKRKLHVKGDKDVRFDKKYSDRLIDAAVLSIAEVKIEQKLRVLCLWRRRNVLLFAWQPQKPSPFVLQQLQNVYLSDYSYISLMEWLLGKATFFCYRPVSCI